MGLFLWSLPGLSRALRPAPLLLRLLAVQGAFLALCLPTLLLRPDALPLVTSQQSMLTAALIGLALPALFARLPRFRDQKRSFGDAPQHEFAYRLARDLLGPAPTAATLLLASALLFPAVGLWSQSLTSLLLFHGGIIGLTLLAGLLVALYNTSEEEPRKV